VEGFALLPRLKTILLSNNKVSSINPNMEKNTANLENIILTNNRIENLSEIDNLAGLKSLHTLSLLKNPITKQTNYRKYCIYKLAALKVLDFQKVTPEVRFVSLVY
jgi:U2 small nuclear ribonucleoprotein A'